MQGAQISEMELDKLVEPEIPLVRKIIAGETRIRSQNLYDAVVRELSEGTRNTPEQLSYLGAYETAVAIFRAAALEIRKFMDVMTLEQRLDAHIQTLRDYEAAKASVGAAPKQEDDGEGKNGYEEGLRNKITDAIFFSNRYALHFAGQVGLEMLGMGNADVKSRAFFGSSDTSTDRDGLTARLATDAADDLRRVIAGKRKAGEQTTDETLKVTMQMIFTAWAKQFSWETWKGVVESYGMESVKLRYKTYSLQSGSFSRKYDIVVVDEKFIPDIRREDVIGSQEFGRTLWRSLLKLGAYDPERRQNPLDPPLCIFTYGGPGGGKTFAAHACIQSLADLCRERGVPLWALTHSTTDYASHFQNLTANALAELGGRIRDFPGAVVMYVADADNILLSRKDPQLTAEQRQTLSVYLKMFDGTLIPKNGKFMAIMDSNDIEGIDEATKSRLFDLVLELKRFDRAEDFAELARRGLTKGAAYSPVTEQEWLEIGTYLLESPLSNREIADHVIKRLRGDFEVNESVVGRQYDINAGLTNQHLGSITKPIIIGACEDYIQKRMEVERNSREAMSRDEVGRFLTYLAIQKGGEAAGR